MSPIDTSDLRIPDRMDEAGTRALADLLLGLADDEFVIGFWDSEWTGIAPVLEEDVAFSSIAQDEIGHASVYYSLLGELTGIEPDRIAYGRPPEGYRQARLLDHPRTDWAFTIARRYLYDFADAVRLEPLAACGWAPLAGTVKKIQREETYHRMHLDAWLERLASAGEDTHRRLAASLERLWPDALSVFTPVGSEAVLVERGILPAEWMHSAHAFLDGLMPAFEELDLPFPFQQTGAETPSGIPVFAPTFEGDVSDGRTRHHDAFRTLWDEFTMVYGSAPEADW